MYKNQTLIDKISSELVKGSALKELFDLFQLQFLSDDHYYAMREEVEDIWENTTPSTTLPYFRQQTNLCLPLSI